VDGRVLCDRCADRRLATATGWPELPPAPGPEVLIGPDGRRHEMTYRLIRMPGAIRAVAEERNAPSASGYEVTLTADHRDDPSALAARLVAATHAVIGRRFLEATDRGDWALSSDEAWGRLEEDDEPYELPRVVIDGRSLSWDEFGRLLQAYVGWDFHLRLGAEPPVTAEMPAVQIAAADRDAGPPVDAVAPEPRWYALDSSHYPTPAAWSRRRHQRSSPADG
jgi:hypothetical protein